MRFMSITTLVLVLAVCLVGCTEQPDSTATPAAQTVSFPEGEQTLYFTVEGMHCQGCANGIEGTASTIAGVVDCTVDFETKYATLHVEDGPIAQDVIEELAKYEYTLTYTTTPPPAPVETTDEPDAPADDTPPTEPEAEQAAA